MKRIPKTELREAGSTEKTFTISSKQRETHLALTLLPDWWHIPFIPAGNKGGEYGVLVDRP